MGSVMLRVDSIVARQLIAILVLSKHVTHNIVLGVCKFYYGPWKQKKTWEVHL